MLNSYSNLYKKVVGKCGGISWQKVNSATNGGWDLRGHPGEYKVTRFTNGWAGEPQYYTITDKESPNATTWQDCYIPS